LTGKYPIENEPVNPLITLRTDVFRSNKISLASANDIIDSLMESSEIMSGTGSVVITQKNGRKTTNIGTIYLRNGLIYAAHIENYKVPIGKRIETGALVRSEDLNEVFNKVGGDTTSPRIVDHLLQNHMVGEKILSSYVKEHFIETLGKIMSWNDSLGEWHPNAVTKDFIMPFVTFDRIREILAHRKHVYGEFLRLVEKFMRPEELPELTFSLLKSPDGTQSPTTLKIISLCDAKNTIDDITSATGVTFYNVFQTIVGLWRDRLVVLNLGGIKIPYASVLVQPEPEHVQAPIQLTNPPIPVHEELDENPEPSTGGELLGANTQGEETIQAEVKSDDTFIISEVGKGKTTPLFVSEQDHNQHDEGVVVISDITDIPRALGRHAKEQGKTFKHWNYQDSLLGIDVIYDPLKGEGNARIDEDSAEQSAPIVKEASEINSDSSSSSGKDFVPPKEILDQRSKVEEITAKLNNLENKLANCEKDLRHNQITLDALEEQKAEFEQKLAEIECDYNRTIAEKDDIQETYESIRKEVEDTISSFTFIEGE
jgi:hypothetical protein